MRPPEGDYESRLGHEPRPLRAQPIQGSSLRVNKTEAPRENDARPSTKKVPLPISPLRSVIGCGHTAFDSL